MKRGQVTLFIILGIVIISIIVMGIYFRSTLLKEDEIELARQLAMPTEIREVTGQVQNCLEIISEEGIIFLGFQGGYIYQPIESLYMENFAVSYGYMDDEISLISLEEIGVELSNYINNEITNCFMLEDYPHLEINEYMPFTSVEFTDEKVIINTEYNMEISKDGDMYRIETPYIVEYDVRLKRIHEISLMILQKIKENPDIIDFQSMLELGVDINIYHIYEDQVVYEIIDDMSKINDEQYSFMFAQK